MWRTGPDHSTEECKKTLRCANCGGDHPVYVKTCEKWKREKEILSVKYTKNISFLEARKIVDATNRDKTYSQAVSLVTSTELTSKYQNLVRKLLQLGPGDWSNFIKNLRAELEEPQVKTNDEGEKVINIPSTQPDNSTQDTPQDRNTERNNGKLSIDCTEHPKKIVLTRIQQKKDLGRK